MDVLIRDARLDDCQAIHQLNSNEMGYEYSYEKTYHQLKYLLKDESHKLFVAESGGCVVGYIHSSHYDLTYSDPLENVLGLAVSSQERGKGIGEKLLQATESWAPDSGAVGVRVVSGEDRQQAHEFYESCGYVMAKVQKNYRKTLTDK